MVKGHEATASISSENRHSIFNTVSSLSVPLRMAGYDAGLVVSALVILAIAVSGSDVNWGKKVPCFEMDGSVICPGCNQRAGLTCPRALKNSRNCLESSSGKPIIEPSTKKPERYPPTQQEPITQRPYKYPPTSQQPSTKEVYPKTIQETLNKDTNSTETTIYPSTTMEEINEISQMSSEYPIDLGDYFYRHFGYRIPTYRYRYRRDIKTEQMALKDEDDIEEGTCGWNADCPCPQICCKTGPGCPKKCVMGIRLPPPWG